MNVINLSQNNSLLNQFVAEIRDEKIQKDRMRFRKNMERCGEILAMEISKTLEYENRNVITPLGNAVTPMLKEQPVVGAILRAGVILHQGMLNYFDQADNAFVSAYRKHHADGSFEIALEYLSCATLENRILILADPMLATGNSMVKTLQQIFNIGKPKHTHLACVIAARAGIELIAKNMSDVTIWACAIDEELNSKSYIVPGLGDAGDLAYGTKMQY
ncbi:MAG: uracil phosphoribosyltransferase [Chitinophagales bacterium]|nr:uracil phosphoribosyltransferase [Chitinophagales bacterium]